MLNRFSNLKIVWKIAATLSALIVLSMIVNGFIFLQRGFLAKTVDWTSHTYEVLEQASGIMAAMVDQETGLRGFLVTGNKANLAPYESGRRNYAERLRKIKELTSDNPAQQERLSQIDQAVQGWNINVAMKAIEFMGVPETRELAWNLERTGAGKQYFDAIRAKIAEVDALERKLLGVRAADQKSAFFSIDLAIGIGAAALLVAAVLFTLLMVSQIARPVSALTGVMSELSNGQLSISIPYTEKADEVGQMAKTLEVFRDNALRVRQMEAEQKEAEKRAADAELRTAEERQEAERRAAADRAAATAKVMEEFDAAVGGIAKAAMAGDFSQRVPLEGKEGVIRNLAEAMNTMCDNIGKVMDDLVDMMAALAEGDLTRRIHADYQGAFGTLKDSANTTAARLAETISEITASAREVANAASEISTSTTDLSQRTEEQAAGLEETSASMEEIASTVKKNAENANQANQLTASAREVANRGGSVVASTVEAMSRIEESSNRIADIIGVIDEIARQTNLLALNAAVEAARAGDAGRGFAVVATEVRSLAQRSSQAAKDIKDLITNSSSQVTEGVDLVNRTGQALNEIVSSIKSVADIVADIATASQEQSTGIDQVNKALTQMDEVTQQNSALVEENAATAKTLETQSANMTDRVSFFRLDPAQSQRVVSMPAKTAEPVAAKPARGGIVGRMQSKLATAFKEF